MFAVLHVLWGFVNYSGDDERNIVEKKHRKTKLMETRKDICLQRWGFRNQTCQPGQIFTNSRNIINMEYKVKSNCRGQFRGPGIIRIENERA